MSDSQKANECQHEDFEEVETGPVDYQGRTDIYLVCLTCGEAYRVDTGSVL